MDDPFTNGLDMLQEAEYFENAFLSSLVTTISGYSLMEQILILLHKIGYSPYEIGQFVTKVALEDPSRDQWNGTIAKTTKKVTKLISKIQ